RHQYLSVRFDDATLAALEAGEREIAPNHLGGNRSHANFAAALFAHYFDQDQLYDIRNDALYQHNRWNDGDLHQVRTRLADQLHALLATFAHPFPREPQAFLDSETWRELSAATRAKGLPQQDWIERDHDVISWPPVR
ncbi:MAG: hypothetical protein ACOCXA_09330, partial [Planctomycetota bacterium]